jgi:hypothetical protein
MTSLRVPDRFRVPKIVWIWLERLGLTPMAVLRHARLPSALYDGERTAVTTAQFFALWPTNGISSLALLSSRPTRQQRLRRLDQEVWGRNPADGRTIIGGEPRDGKPMELESSEAGEVPLLNPTIKEQILSDLDQLCPEQQARAAEFVHNLASRTVPPGERGCRGGVATDRNYERVRPILEILGTLRHTGGPGSGAAMKLVANLVLGAAIVTLGEALEAPSARRRELEQARANRAWLDDAAGRGAADLDFSAVIATIRGGKP